MLTQTATTASLEELLAAPPGPRLLPEWAHDDDLEACVGRFSRAVLGQVWESPQLVLRAVDHVTASHQRQLSAPQQAVLVRLRAHALRAVGQVRAAVREYRRATRAFLRCSQEEEAGRTAVGHLYALALLGRCQDALQVARDGRPRLAEDAFRTRARLELNLAHVFLHARQLPEAQHRYRTALARCERAQDVAGMGACWHHLAIVATHQGDARTAVALFRRARQCFEQTNMTLPSMYCDAGLALAELSLGRWETALEQLRQLRERFLEHGDDRAEGLVQREIASGFLALGALDTARDEALQAVAKFRGLGLDEDAARLDAVVGRLYAMRGWFGEAYSHLVRARAFYDAQGNRWMFHRSGVDLARVLVSTSRPVEALPILRAARRYLDRVDPNGTAAICCGVRAEAHLALGRARVALRLAKEARRRATDHPASLHRPQLSSLVAQCYALQDRHQDVVRWARRSIEELEVVLRRFGGRQLRETMSESRDAIYNRAIALIQAHAGPNSTAEVLDLVAQARASVLVEECLHGSDGSLQREARAAISRLRDDLLQDPHGMDIRLQQVTVQKEIRRLSRRLDRRLEGSPEVVRRRTAECTHARWAPRLGARELVMFDRNQDGWRAFLVKSDCSVREVPLPNLDTALREQWRPLSMTFQTAASVTSDRREEFLERTREDSTRRFSVLEEALWGALPVESRSVVVVPHEDLHDLPLEALAGDRIEVMTRLPHPALLKRATRREARPGAALVLHGPSHATADEARTIAATLASSSFQVEVSSSRAALLQDTRWSVLHIASHGTLHPEGWLLSGLELGDGWIGFESLARPSLRGALLYLSSCESGATHRSAGSNLRGWLAAGLGAGARQMMLTLWKLDDVTAARFSSSFYAEWTREGDAAGAAMRARRSLRAHSAHPFTWASFVAVG